MRPCLKINKIFSTILLIVICSPLFSLQVAAVQWQVRKSRIESGSRLKDTFNILLYQNGFKANQPSLIVFPEYTTVFLMGSFLLDRGYIKSLEPRNLLSYMRNNRISGLGDLFMIHNKEYQEYAMKFWRDFSMDWTM